MEKLKNVLIIVALTSILIFLFANYNKSVREKKLLIESEREINERLAFLQNQRMKLEEATKMIEHNPAFFEKIAKKELKLLHKDEYIWQIPVNFIVVNEKEKK